MNKVERRLRVLPYHYGDSLLIGNQLEWRELLYHFNQF